MEFLLLGPLEARQRGEQVPLGSRRAERCLLGILLLEAGSTVSYGRIADLLWGNDPPRHPPSVIQSHVSRLRSRVDPARDGAGGVRLVRDGKGYRAEIDSQLVDVHRFQLAVAHAAEEPDPAGRAAMLRSALSLWRGPLLAGVASDELRDRLGASLTEMRSHAHANLAMSLGHLCRFEESVAEIEQALHHAWLCGDESFEAALICGSFADALDRTGQYARARDLILSALPTLRRIGAPFDLAYAMCSLGRIHGRLEDYDLAFLQIDEALATARAVGDRRPEALALGSLAEVHYGLGDFDKAVALAESAVPMLQDAMRAQVLLVLAASYSAAGHHAEALSTWDQTLDLARDVGTRHYEARARLGLGKQLSTVDPAQAREHLEAAAAMQAELLPHEAADARWTLATLAAT